MAGRMFGKWSPRRVTLVYALFGTVWIVGSDRVAAWLFPTLSAQSVAQTAKGLLFILLTSTLVYLLVRAAARDLRTSELLNREIIESAHEGVIVFDRELRYVLWNPFMEQMTGMPASAVLGQKALDVFPRLRDLGIAELLERALRGETVTSEDLRSPLPHLADRTWYVGTYAPRHDDAGNIIGVVALLHDISKRKQAELERAKLEAQLRQAQKMEAIGLLAGGVAHDFNNVLTAILGNVELGILYARRELPAKTQLVETFEQIEQSARRAAALTRQLLAFSRRQTLQPEVLNLNHLLTDLEKMLARLISANITLTIDTTPELRTVRADGGNLQQVVVNLVVNAADAMPEGGRITITTRNVELDETYVAMNAEAKPGHYVQLAITDTGCGMDAAIRERIFEPFFTTKPMDKGTGLGLATVYGIVKQCGGHITVYSEPGNGTCFKTYLPVIDGPVPAARIAEALDEPVGGHERILLCEDDRAVRELTAQLLQAAGYRVLVSESGPHALQLAQEYGGDIDLLITDVIMPETNGSELARQLRSILPHLPTLFMSGYTANVIAHHGVLEGNSAFLEKPFTRRGLLLGVREALRTSCRVTTGAERSHNV